MKTNGQLMQDVLDDALATGEEPYQSNRAAVKEFDIFGDEAAGARKIRETMAGIDAFVAKLEGFKDVAEAVNRRAISLVR